MSPAWRWHVARGSNWSMWDGPRKFPSHVRNETWRAGKFRATGYLTEKTWEDHGEFSIASNKNLGVSVVTPERIGGSGHHPGALDQATVDSFQMSMTRQLLAATWFNLPGVIMGNHGWWQQAE